MAIKSTLLGVELADPLPDPGQRDLIPPKPKPKRL
jgi:hypothetical protein